eukprot:TRINITY_DN2007_c0_g1_i1.p1 TRINITY_DN2007_c0_g1~~TRINITY_DN2007_c0_g1_i1.p1  ORF type:complete len:261 (+),score=98.84 TRINITY_DN2007_c0_g1_i1:47-784(+)
MKGAPFLMALCIMASAENLDPKRVWMIDYHDFGDGTGNFLFRGNAPIKNESSFAYDELVSVMGQRANASGVAFPSKFYFVDITLDNDFDGSVFTIEREYWAKQGSTQDFGIMLHWLFAETAGVLPPSAVPVEFERRKICDSGDLWLVDQLPTRLAFTRSMLLTQRYDKLPVVMYVHCVGGCDRTGEFVATYRLQYGSDKNITDLYNRDIQECGRAPNKMATLSIEWYCACYHLNTGSDVGKCDSL